MPADVGAVQRRHRTLIVQSTSTFQGARSQPSRLDMVLDDDGAWKMSRPTTTIYGIPFHAPVI
jgi:hypothetical protein